MRKERLDRSDFYVYTYAYPDSSVFYVGKGCNGRIEDHEKEARKGHQCQRCDIIRSIWAKGEHVIKRKIRESLPEDEAYHLEDVLIESLGWRTLTNLQGGHKIDRWN